MVRKIVDHIPTCLFLNLYWSSTSSKAPPISSIKTNNSYLKTFFKPFPKTLMSTYALRMIMITRLSFFLLFMWCSWPQTHEKCVGSWFLVGLSRYYFVSTFAADHIKFHADHLKSWWWTWKIRSPGSCFTKHESNINHQAWCFIHDDTTLARIKKDECFGKNVFVKPQKACNLKYETFYWGDSPPNNHQNYSQWSDLKIPFFWPFFI